MDPNISRNQVLLRYALPADYTTAIFSNSSGESVAFVNLLTRCFEDDGTFQSDDFSTVPLSLLLDYIRRTHSLYLNKSLQEIEQTIGLLNEAYVTGHPALKMLNEFYLSYKSELIHHIRLEDDFLIPYITYLDEMATGVMDPYVFYSEKKQFSISEFTELHEDNDAELDRVRKKLLSYEPPATNKFLYGVLVNQLNFFRQDLKIHGLIEDQVLVPRALELEKSLERIFIKKVRLN